MIRKSTGDIGIAAYVLMHGFKVLGKKNKDIIFTVEEKESTEFDSCCLEYLSSDFHRFDACLMALKKVGEHKPAKNGNIKSVSDLGIAAYILMHGYKVVGREGRFVYFQVDDKDLLSFDKLSLDYLSSDYHKFDANIMALKKLSQI